MTNCKLELSLSSKLTKSLGVFMDKKRMRFFSLLGKISHLCRYDTCSAVWLGHGKRTISAAFYGLLGKASHLWGTAAAACLQMLLLNHPPAKHDFIYDFMYS